MPPADGTDHTAGSPPPLLRIVRGNPTDEEVAALVAVVAARGAAAAGVNRAADRRQRSGWADHARGVRGRHLPGPGAWRASAFPA
ncbi:MAG: acyl-CoA carboxylase subunit epsilon [Propionibacteriales bacterium]|nr:acyl-CoA carboxylase subunit epsilon [Propionibacteriales bacterium]